MSTSGSGKPTFINPPPPPAADQHSIVRTRSYRVDRIRALDMLQSVLVLVQSERTTGTIYVDLSTGNPVMIRVEESQRIGPVRLGEDLPL